MDLNVSDDVSPAPELRSRVLAEARRRRAPAAVAAGASPIDVHRVEAARVILLLQRPGGRRLGPPGRPHRARRLDRPRRRGPPRGQRVAAGSPARCAGARHPGDRHRQRAHRTAQARARHAGRPPTRAVAELEVAAKAIDTELAIRGRPVSTSRSTGGAGVCRHGSRCWCVPSRRGPTRTTSVVPSASRWWHHRRPRSSRWPAPDAASCRACSLPATCPTRDASSASASPTSAAPPGTSTWEPSAGCVRPATTLSTSRSSPRPSACAEPSAPGSTRAA